jgi:hypothetical protein
VSACSRGKDGTPRLKLKSDLVYREQPVQVLDSKERATRNNVVKTYKIQWSHHDEGDATWETGEYLQKAYEDFYNKWFITQISGQDFYKGRVVTPRCYTSI